MFKASGCLAPQLIYLTPVAFDFAYFSISSLPGWVSAHLLLVPWGYTHPTCQCTSIAIMFLVFHLYYSIHPSFPQLAPSPDDNICPSPSDDSLGPSLTWQYDYEPLAFPNDNATTDTVTLHFVFLVLNDDFVIFYSWVLKIKGMSGLSATHNIICAVQYHKVL